MKILFLVPYVPSRIRVRSYQLIRTLAARGHQVSLATLWSSDDERRELQELSQYCTEIDAVHLPRWRSMLTCLAALPTNTPLQAVYGWDKGLARRATAMAKKADVVHVEHLRGSMYALHLQAELEEAGSKTPIVWDSVDSISLLFRQAAQHAPSPARRLLTRAELRRTELHEGRIASAFDRTLVTSRIDEDALLSLCRNGSGRPHISILPNGVDMEYFHPAPDSAREPATLVISGKMSYHANASMAVSFVRDCLPEIRRRCADVRVLVVGKNPPGEVRALGRQPGVTVTGTVPDVRPFLQGATLAIAPLTYGVGIQNKILEAMACATPVAAYPKAVAALEAVDGQDLVVAEGAQALADAVVSLLADAPRRLAIGHSGRRYVEMHHNWAATVARLEEIYDEVIRSRR